MIPGIDLLSFVSLVGVLGVALLIFAESGLLIGFFLPGDSVLFASGLLINTGVLHINVIVAILLFFIATTVGNSVGYLFGQKAGPRIFAKEDARLFKRAYITRAQDFYERRGGLSIILARFIPVVRTFAPIVAGAGSMPYRRFIMFNMVGGFIWTAGVTLLGYYLGSAFKAAGIDVDTVLLPIIALIIFLSILPPLLHIFLNKNRRRSFVHGFKREIRALLRRSKT